MKFTCTVNINLPREKVVELWNNPDHFDKWQDTFLRSELVSGVSRTEGAITKLYLSQGKSEMLLTETILKNELPDSFKGLYEHEHMVNTMTSEFISIEDKKTTYNAYIDYTQFMGLMPKIMAFLFPGMFKKQTQKWLDQFKVFAEGY